MWRSALVGRPRVWLTQGVDLVRQLAAVMGDLAGLRPVFHSEADFQLALAWQVQHADPHATVRLETRPSPVSTWTSCF